MPSPGADVTTTGIPFPGIVLFAFEGVLPPQADKDTTSMRNMTSAIKRTSRRVARCGSHLRSKRMGAIHPVNMCERLSFVLAGAGHLVAHIEAASKSDDLQPHRLSRPLLPRRNGRGSVPYHRLRLAVHLLDDPSISCNYPRRDIHEAPGSPALSS